MAPVTTYDGLLARIGSGYWATQPIYDFNGTAGVILGGNGVAMMRSGRTMDLPALPGGVSAYIPTMIGINDSNAAAATAHMVVRLISLGTLDISTPTFTNGSNMPTVTEAGVSRTTCGAVWIEVTTALNATPGSITITYNDQDGNTAETTTAQALGASAPVGSSGWIALNAPDIGVRDITTATRTGGTTPTGVLTFWGVIPLALINSTTTANLGGVENLITSGFNCQRLAGSEKIGVFAIGTTIKAISGSIFFVGDS